MNTRTEKNKEIQTKLEAEKKRSNIKKAVKFFIKFTLCLIIIFFSFFFYTKYYSTTGLIVKEQRIKNSKIPTSFQGVKIIQFSDLYYNQTISSKEVKKIVKMINLRKPDLVIFTGNLIDPSYNITTKEKEKLITELKKITSTIGKYAVDGQTDNDSFVTILTQSDFTILNNSYDLLYNEDNNPILLVGLSSLIQKKRDVDKSFNYFQAETHNSNIYTITIMSETDGLDEILNSYNNDLVLAGNSLNGQIRIPPFQGLITKKGSKKYKNPYYKVGDSKIYISSGIGSPDIGFRFFVRPSINFFRLSN